MGGKVPRQQLVTKTDKCTPTTGVVMKLHGYRPVAIVLREILLPDLQGWSSKAFFMQSEEHFDNDREAKLDTKGSGTIQVFWSSLIRISPHPWL